MGDLGPASNLGEARGIFGGLGNHFMSDSSRLDWARRWFGNLGKDSLVLGRGSSDGFHRG